ANGGLRSVQRDDQLGLERVESECLRLDGGERWWRNRCHHARLRHETMKTIILIANRRKPWIGCCAALTGLAFTNVASAAQLAEAKVTAVVHDVKLLRGQAVLRPATVNDEIRQDTAVRTGLES